MAVTSNSTLRQDLPQLNLWPTSHALRVSYNCLAQTQLRSSIRALIPWPDSPEP